MRVTRPRKHCCCCLLPSVCVLSACALSPNHSAAELENDGDQVSSSSLPSLTPRHAAPLLQGPIALYVSHILLLVTHYRHHHWGVRTSPSRAPSSCPCHPSRRGTDACERHPHPCPRRRTAVAHDATHRQGQNCRKHTPVPRLRESTNNPAATDEHTTNWPTYQALTQ